MFVLLFVVWFCWIVYCGSWLLFVVVGVLMFWFVGWVVMLVGCVWVLFVWFWFRLCIVVCVYGLIVILIVCGLGLLLGCLGFGWVCCLVVTFGCFL